jgi:Fe-S-cluster containining protein
MYRIGQLLDRMEERKAGRRLEYVYQQIPSISCQECGSCCFNGPETFFVEFLNIFQYLKTLPLSLQKETIRKIILYEFYNLVTLDYTCPFLESNKCVIYPSRALQCRFFSLHPREEYREFQLSSRSHNQQLINLYKDSHGIILPEKVLTYDIDQCDNNKDSNEKTVIVSRLEREYIHQQLMIIESDIVNIQSVEKTETRGRFTHYFCMTYSNENKVETEKIKAIKEYQKNRNTAFIDKIIKEYQAQYFNSI